MGREEERGAGSEGRKYRDTEERRRGRETKDKETWREMRKE